jgi:hypothetical protein
MSTRRNAAALPDPGVPGLHKLSINAVLLDERSPTVVDLEEPVMLDSVILDELGYYVVLEWNYRDVATGESDMVEVPTLVRTKEGGGWEYLVVLPDAEKRDYESLNENTRVVRRPNEWTLNERRQLQDLQQRHAFSIREAMDGENDHFQQLAQMNDPESQERFYKGVLLIKVGLVRDLLSKLTDEQLEAYYGWGLGLALQLLPGFDPDNSKASKLARLKSDKQAEMARRKEAREAEEQRAAAASGQVDPDLYD